LQREKIDWQVACKFDCWLVWTIFFVVLRDHHHEAALAKHNTKFMQDCEYYNIQENHAMKATNQSGECIFSTLNRVLSSHPNVRAPIISGMKALGEALFQEIHDTYAYQDEGSW